MTKQLSPLEALEKLNHTICLNVNSKTLTFGLDKYDNCDCKDIKEFGKCYDIIEKALKELEEYKKCIDLDEAYYVSTHGIIAVEEDTYKDLIRNSKALEIIKRCNDECPDYNKIFKYSCYDRPQDMGCPLHLDYLIIGNSCFIISKEEYDLLKEVLL